MTQDRDVIVVRLPLRFEVVLRAVNALAVEFPEAAWVDDPEDRGGFAIDVTYLRLAGPGDGEGDAGEPDGQRPQDDDVRR
jgi:hypothetical protein